MPSNVRIGGAVIDFVGRNAQFLQRTRQTGQALRRQEQLIRGLRRTYREFNRTAQESVRRFTSLTTAAGILAGSAGIGLLVRNSIRSAAEIRSLAEQAGATNEAFQELTHVSTAFNVSQDALVDGLKELNLRVDEFVSTGAGPARESLERLGFEMEDLRAGLQDSGILFEDVIARMQRLDTAARIRVADELFGGTAGEQFVRIVEGGVMAVQRLRREAHDTGLVMQDAMLDRADRLNVQLQVIESQFRTNLNRAILDNADSFEELAGQAASAVPHVVNLADALTRVVTVLSEHGDTIVRAAAALGLGARAAAVTGRFGPQAGAAGFLAGAGAGLLGADLAIDALTDEVESLDAALADAQRRLEELDRFSGTRPDFVAAQREVIEAQIREIRGLQLAARTTVPMPDPEVARSTAPTTLPLGSRSDLYVMERRLPAAAFVLTQEFRTVRDAAVDVDEAIQLVGGRLEEMPDAVRDTSLAMQSLERLSAGVGANLGQFVANLGQNINSLSESLRNLADSILQILRTELIARPIAEAIQGGLLGNAGFLGALGGIRGAQAGGYHRGLTLVGEQGPELVNLGSGAHVTPAGETRRMLGGVTLAPVFNVSGGADAGVVREVFQQEVFPAMRALVRATVSESER